MKFTIFSTKNDDTEEQLMSFDSKKQAEDWIQNYNENARKKRVFRIEESKD